MMDAMFAVTQRLLAARSEDPSQLVRELADFSHFETGLTTVVAKSPADATAFRRFLRDLAYTPIRTRRWVSHAEARAIAKIEDAVAA